MMLFNNFFTITSQKLIPGHLQASIRFNREHAIFDGHFPGAPVVPGVCMLQIVREILEEATQKKYMITNADNIKFLAVINPDQQLGVNVDITYTKHADGFQINATLFEGELVFFKLVKATLQS